MTNNFKISLSSVAEDINIASNGEDIDNSISSFSDIMNTGCVPLFERHINNSQSKSQNVNKSRNTVFDEACGEKKKEFFKHLNAYRKNKKDENRANLVFSRSAYKKTVWNFNFEQDKLKSTKLLKAKLNNAKKYWKLLKESVTQSKPKNLSADHFHDYFKAINNPSDPFFQPEDDIVYFNEHFLKSEMEIIFDELNTTITETEICKAIKQLKNGKSGGPDMLLNEFFIHGVNELLPYLYNLFNKILDLGHFPEVWSEGYVMPIHKKGKLDDVNNFRSIILLSTLGKLFTRVLNNRLTTWVEEYYIYIEAQAGFRANTSTADNMFVLHGIINHMLNSNKKLFCAFVDFTKSV